MLNFTPQIILSQRVTRAAIAEKYSRKTRQANIKSVSQYLISHVIYGFVSDY